MYAASFFGLGHLAVLLMLGGGFGLPLGVPPLPEDPMMAKIAPEECLMYMASAGIAAPDAKSVSPTEQLLAEPEVLAMASELERAIRAGLARATGRGGLPPGISSDDMADLVKLLLTRPLAVHVSSVQVQPSGPVVRGGLAINLGDDLAKVKSKIEQITKGLPPEGVKKSPTGDEQWQLDLSSLRGGPPIKLGWGFHDKCLLLTAGEGEFEAMLKRAQGTPPAWLVKLRQSLPVERLSTVTYLNLKAITGIAIPMAGPRAADMLKALGLGNVTALASVTGLDQKGCVSKTLLGIDGDPEGILRLANVNPLVPSDLAPIPSDATFAVALKLNLTDVLDTALATAEKIEPRAKEEMLREIGQMEEHLDLKLRDDVLKPLGDTWRLYDSPSEGGLFTGLTLVVSLADAKRAAATEAKLVGLVTKQHEERMRRILDNTPADDPRAHAMLAEAPIGKLPFAGREIHMFNGGDRHFFLAPSWCLTEKELIVALYPQSIKAYLSRGADFQSLAQVPEVARLFQGDAGPIKMAYCNTQRVFDLIYPFAPAWATIATREMARGGVNLNASILPSARSIRPHLTPVVVAVRRTKAGIEFDEQHPLPGPSMATTVPIGIGLLLPAVQSSRVSARRMQSMNNLKQIALALHNYAQANKKFPPAYTVDKNGKPLLSWRVLILPYLEADNLYREFHLDEPWDSEHNKKLIARMPAFCSSPNSQLAGQWKTNYLTVRGPKTIFPGKDPIGFAEIRDGTSNTIMTVEASDQKAVVWTKPDDFAYDQKDPKKGLIGLQPGGFIAGMADGSVRFFPSIDPTSLNALFTRNGGEVVDSDNLRQ